MDENLETRVLQYRRKRARIEFLKSTVIFSLAILLLVGAVLAWFSTSNNAIIEPITLSINSGSGIQVGSSVTSATEIYLPCATSLSLPQNQLARALKIETFELTASSTCTVNIEVSWADDCGLGCYIDTYPYDTDDPVSANIYAGILKEPSFTQSNTKSFAYNENDKIGDVYKREITIVFWATYGSGVVSNLLNENGIPVNINFTT